MAEHAVPQPGRPSALLLYAVLLFLALLFLLPVYVMLVNSLKPLDEIRSGDLMALPVAWTVAAVAQRLEHRPDRRAADRAAALLRQLVPAGGAGGGDLDADRRAQRLHPHPVPLPRRRAAVRCHAVLGVHPVPDRADPDGQDARRARPGRHGEGTGVRQRRLRHRLHDAVLPQLLRGVPLRAGALGAHGRRRLLRRAGAHPAAQQRADHRRHGDLAVHQHLERVPVRRLVQRLLLPSRSPWR